MRTHEERMLVAKLSALNADLSRFILAVIAADHTGTHWPHSAEAEEQLGVRLVELRQRVQTHAAGLKGVSGAERSPIVIDGGVEPDRPDDSAEQ